ncbi:MAG: redoxin domain-containing protein [Saprospiraceae bacterium]|jgi:peroxiredoxin|nr:redoxin domain-containing protein [Saprospiraceae bacterium]
MKIGDIAPEFSLYSDEKSLVSLSDFKGRSVVLLFFPLAFTGVCTQELCAIRDDIKYYESLNAQILGISVDSIFTLQKFKQEQGYNFPLLSDFNKEVSTAYGTIYDSFVMDMKGVSKRSAFVVDPNGKIAYVEVLENAGEIPNFDAVKNCLVNLS